MKSVSRIMAHLYRAVGISILIYTINTSMESFIGLLCHFDQNRCAWVGYRIVYQILSLRKRIMDTYLYRST